MINKTKIIGTLVMISALVVLAIFIFNVSGKNSARLQRLPDGAWLRIGKISYGSETNRYFYWPGVAGWRTKAAMVIPRGILGRLGWTGGGGLKMITSGTSVVSHKRLELFCSLDASKTDI